jgi:hypothetical protein
MWQILRRSVIVGDSQSFVHVPKGLFGLVEEVEYYRSTELSITRLVHLQYLAEGVHIHSVPKIESDAVAGGLSTSQYVLCIRR